jgi:uncharacterized protein (UPF0218 family)
VLSLPPALRDALREPFGPVYTDAEALLADAGRPVVAVGDVVAYHIRRAGHDPRVAVVDGRTEREAVDEAVGRVAADGTNRLEVRNPPAELSRDLLVALRAALDGEGDTVVVVDGEEDLATLPAVLAAPLGASVVYGQPGEGMVLVDVTEANRDAMSDLLARFDGDADAALAILDGAAG